MYNGDVNNEEKVDGTLHLDTNVEPLIPNVAPLISNIEIQAENPEIDFSLNDSAFALIKEHNIDELVHFITSNAANFDINSKDYNDDGRTLLLKTCNLLDDQLSPLLFFQTDITNIENKKIELFSKMEEIIGILLDNGANPNIENIFGYTPLTSIMCVRNPMAIKIAELLVKYNADINHQIGGKTPLYFAITEQNPKGVEFLIQQNVNLHNLMYVLISIKNDADEFGITQMLITAGADIDEEDENGLTPLDFARGLEQDDIVEMLESKIGLAQPFKKHKI